MQYETTIGDTVYTVEVDTDKNRAVINETEYPFEVIENSDTQLLLRSGTKLYKVRNIDLQNDSIECTVNGKWITAGIKDEQQLLLEKLGFKTSAEKSVGELEAPMPGKILELLATEGDDVELGDPVAILEAMKMENELKAPCAGTIKTISVTTGSSVEKNQLLLEIEPRG
ncbi:MAG: acetyl-CoA carboxylase biotin carboxyl carrier protein subunit [Bacteroidota bacterium]